MYLNMVNTLIDFALAPANVAVTNLIVPFKNGMVSVKDNYNSIINLRNQAKEVITNFAAEKKALRKKVIDATYTICKSVYAYGITTGNQQVISAMKITKRRLNGLKEQTLINTANAAIEAVNGIIDALAPYQVTPQVVEEWQNDVNSYLNILAAPRSAIVRRKSLNTQADELLDATVTLIQNVLDPLALNYIQLNNAYFLQYRGSRRLIGSSRHTRFVVNCSDDAGNPVYGVIITQNGTNNNAVTDINGQAIVFIDVAHGQNPVYSFTIASGSQQQQSGNIQILKGHTVTRSYTVQPSGFVIPAFEPQPSSQNA